MSVTELEHLRGSVADEHPARAVRPPRPTRPRQHIDLPSTVILGVALALALIPLLRQFAPGTWQLTTITLLVVLLGVAWLISLTPLRPGGGICAQALVTVGLVTVIFFPTTAIGAVVPTGATVERLVASVAAGVQQIRIGTVPVPATTDIDVTLACAFALVVIAASALVLWARLPLIGGFLVLAVAAAAGAAVPDGGDLGALAGILACGCALLYRHRVLTRPRASRGAGPTATAAGMLAASLVVATGISPLVPAAVTGSALPQFGGTRVDATIDLGRDLRRPNPVEVLQYRASTPTPPYLRLVTLSHFGTGVWTPDSPGTDSLDWLAENPAAPQEEIARTAATAKIDVGPLQTDMVPVPDRVGKITGLEGSWSASPSGRSVSGDGLDIGGHSYETAFLTVAPTLEQIRATSVAIENADPAVLTLPSDVPDLLLQDAQQVTADAGNAYDKLIALQTWFRSSQFAYSLDAPVERGYDNTSMSAMQAFLTQRSGYCVHFASAFALMARSLGMPSRVVLGFLPGEPTGEVAENETVYGVTSAQLHTWPEVLFEGIGWVPFDPTPTLGTPTAFTAAANSGSDTSEPQAPSPAPTHSAVDDSPVNPEPTAETSTGTNPIAVVLPLSSIILTALVLLAIPALVRTARRGRRRAAAAHGDAAAAWTEMLAMLQDRGFDPSVHESPRALATRAAAEGYATSAVLHPLLDGFERRSYAAATTDAPDGAELVTALDAVARADSASGWMRVRHVIFPRSVLTTLIPDARSRAPRNAR